MRATFKKSGKCPLSRQALMKLDKGKLNSTDIRWKILGAKPSCPAPFEGSRFWHRDSISCGDVGAKNAEFCDAGPRKSIKLPDDGICNLLARSEAMEEK